MTDEFNEKPLGLESFRETQVLSSLNFEKKEAHEVAVKSQAIIGFEFNDDELELFKLALAKYNLVKRDDSAFFDQPEERVIGKIPIINFVHKIAKYGRRIDNEVLERINQEIKQLRNKDVEEGRYTHHSIINAANFISTAWFDFRKEGKNFEESVRSMADRINNKILTKSN